jgi:hypothetical protein
LHMSADQELNVALPDRPPVTSTNPAQMVQPKPRRSSPTASLRHHDRRHRLELRNKMNRAGELEPWPRNVATSPPALRLLQTRPDDCRTSWR